jgi:hypothetical protein
MNLYSFIRHLAIENMKRLIQQLLSTESRVWIEYDPKSKSPTGWIEGKKP